MIGLNHAVDLIGQTGKKANIVKLLDGGENARRWGGYGGGMSKESGRSTLQPMCGSFDIELDFYTSFS